MNWAALDCRECLLQSWFMVMPWKLISLTGLQYWQRHKYYFVNYTLFTLFTYKFILHCPRHSLQSSAAQFIPQLAAWHTTLQPIIGGIAVLLPTPCTADTNVVSLLLRPTTSRFAFATSLLFSFYFRFARRLRALCKFSLAPVSSRLPSLRCTGGCDSTNHTRDWTEM